MVAAPTGVAAINAGGIIGPDIDQGKWKPAEIFLFDQETGEI